MNSALNPPQQTIFPLQRTSLFFVDSNPQFLTPVLSSSSECLSQQLLSFDTHTKSPSVVSLLNQRQPRSSAHSFTLLQKSKNQLASFLWLAHSCSKTTGGVPPFQHKRFCSPIRAFF